MKRLMSAAAVMAIAATTAPAHAVVVLCQTPNCVTTDENVLVSAQSANAVILGSTNLTGTGVTFTSPVGELLVGGANGQAKVSAADQLLNGLTFTIQPGKVFQTALFNLFPLSGTDPDEAPFADISWIGPGGNSGVTTIALAGNGQNDTGIYGTAGELFTSITFRANPLVTGIDDLKQLRLGGIGNIDNPPPPPPPPPPPAIPEASTWAMMIIGFGTMGAAIRRKQARHTAMA